MAVIETYDTRVNRAPLMDFTRQHLLFFGFAAPPTFDSAIGRVRAFVSDSRWVVACPGPDCNGAQLASTETPYFMCVECANIENNGNWYNVIFHRSRARIESMLLRRPKVNRNWLLTETVADLQRENVDHGLDDS
jgi:hypothetical protein